MAGAERPAPSRREELAKMVTEKVIATCRECDVDLNFDEDLSLIMAVAHNDAAGHEVAVWTNRTEILKGRTT